MKKLFLYSTLTLSLLSLNLSSAKADWWDKLCSAVSSTWQPVWGKYTEGGSTNTYPPLTTFSRNPDVYWIQRETIRTNIKMAHDSLDYNFLYSKIYSSACGGDVFGDIYSTDGATECAGAKMAKDAAFVYLMGFDADGKDLDATTRLQFHNKAVYILSNCYGMRLGTPFAGKDNQMYRAYELIEYLQAHDYLVTAKAVGLTYSDDDYENSRDQLKQFTVDLYGCSNNIFESLDSYNNQSLIVAGAVGMAAVELSDMGTYFWAIQRRPERWANAAHAYINRTLWTGPGTWGELTSAAPGPMSEKYKIAGYAEGPHYFELSMESLLPFFKSFNNFVNRDMEGEYYTSALNFFPEKVRNYVYDGNYDNLYKWASNIRMPNGENPSYDDTHKTYSIDVLALTQKPEFSRVTEYDKLNLGISLEEDYLASFNYPKIPNDQNAFIFQNAGDLVVRTPWNTPLKDAHYFHMNCENGTALNGYRPFDWGHEHGDAGSFIIGAGEDVLAMDPPNYGWSYRDDINGGHRHNVITIDGAGPEPTQSSYANIQQFGNVTLSKLATTYKGFWGDDVAHEVRDVEVWKGNPFKPSSNALPPYYVINDYVTSNESSSIFVQFNLNGNGLSGGSNPSFQIDPVKNNVAVWDYPCKKDNMKSDHWKMRATLTTQIQGQTTSNFWTAQNGSWHGNNAFNYSNNTSHTFNIPGTDGNITTISTIGAEKRGEHTRATKQLSITEDQVAHFKVTIEVLGCEDDSTPSPQFVQNTNHTGHTIIRNENEKLYNFHFSRTGGGLGYDTVNNPLFIENDSTVFGTNAQSAFLSWAQDSLFKSGSCTSYTKFREASIFDGDSLQYVNRLISSNVKITLSYSLVGKYKYKGVVTAPTGGAIVTFCIPDLVSLVPMRVLKGYNEILPITYDDTTNWNYITVTFPAGTTNFSIEPENPCMFDCYFPPLGVNINDTIFNADDKDQHTLGHKLTILNHGLLHVTNGTRIDMCDGVYMRNCDSLIIEGPCQTSTKNFDACTGIEKLIKTDQSSAIIVSAGSSLVLDSGSYTYLKGGGAIWVKQNGSLVIKDYAFVQIGNSPNYCGFGEIITEPGSYIYIEPNAHIEFGKTIGDTVDRNLFNISRSYAGTTAGVYPQMAAILDYDTILTAGLSPIAICDLDSINPVKNREWGYANFMRPLAYFQVRSDTICPGDPLCIHLNRILNSSSTFIKICRMDSIQLRNSKGNLYWQDTCIKDTLWQDSIPPGDNPCHLIHTLPDDVCYYFHPNTLHRVTIDVVNDCNIHADTIAYIYVADSPQFSLSVPPNVCSGVGTLTVGVTDVTHQPGYYTFEIAELPDSLELVDAILHPQDTNKFATYYESNFGYLPSTFNFSSFKIKGNHTYLVSLSITNNCGRYSNHGRFSTPLSAQINIHLASTYNNPFGPAAFQLQGIVTGATSYSWSPTTYLDYPDSLNPVSTPSEPVQYILSATDGTCYDYDTVTVLHKNIANAGKERTICYNEQTALGTNFNAPIFLTLMRYVYGDASSFDNMFNNYHNGQNISFKYFTSFMIDHLNDYSSNQFVSTFISIDSTRSKMMNRSWFRNLLNSYLMSTSELDLIEQFSDNINSQDSELKSDIDALSLTLDGGFIENMFYNYAAYYTENYISDRMNLETVWENKYLTSTSWSSCPTWSDNVFNLADVPQHTKQYRITVINNELNTVEYDSVIVFVDSALNVSFYNAYQIDSTVYFANTTTPFNNANTYDWDFGDGSIHSTLKYPVHTFTRFDSTYTVCLSASNNCGSYTFCDTVRVDSLGLLMSGFNKKGKETTKAVRSIIENPSDNHKNDNYLSVNIPNPFSEETIVQYALSDGKQDGELRISTPLGKILNTYKLNQNQGLIVINGSTLSDGMYYYTLIVDGAVVGSKVMVVQK